MILIISSVFYPEPVVSARLSYDIAIELAKQKEVTVIAPVPTRPLGMLFKEEPNREEFCYIQLKSFTCPQSSLYGRSKESFSFGFNSYKYVSKHFKEISLIYANAWPLFAQLFIVKAAKKYHIPVIMHVQDVYPESIEKKLPVFLGKILHKVLLPIDRYILKNSENVIVISENMKKYLVQSRKINDDCIKVIRNWQNESEFPSIDKVHNKKNAFTFMYVGSINSSAGVDLIIHSFGQANLKNCKLIVAGDGPSKAKCLEIAKGYPNAIINFCSVTKDKVPKLQTEADVLLLSLKKGIGHTASPSKFIAYLFSAKPVIASIDHNSDVAMIINETRCGYTIPPDDKNALSAAMRNITTLSRSHLNTMGINGYNYAISNYSRENNLQKIIQIFEQNTK